MDLNSILDRLHARKRILDEVIRNMELLEEFNDVVVTPRGRRGRKEMPAAEREMVAERMRKYWAARKSGGK